MKCNEILTRFSATVILFVIPFILNAFQQKPISSIDAKSNLREAGTLPKHIKEASGLEITNGKNLWTHNDGGVPILYCIDTTGALVKTLQLNHPNSGWEDLTLDKKGNLYVGAFGNNKNDKKSVKIYKIANPDSITAKVYSAEIINYHYADQKNFPPPLTQKNFDMDAFVALDDSLYLFSKNRTSPFTGYTKIYSLPQMPGDYTATPIDSIFLGKGSMMDYWVTGADISPDGKTLVLLSHRSLWVVTKFYGTKFSSGKITRINLNHFSHKAGVCFSSNSRLYIVDELEFDLIGGKIYTLDLDQIVTNQ